MQPRVTIIIPTYNRARLVSHAIDSALGQSYANLDVIVVDDGSTDDMQDTLQRYAQDPRVQLARHERNRGVTAALNTGLSHLGAETAYFGFLGSDDELVPEAVDLLMRVFETSPDSYSLVLGWCGDLDSGAPSGQMTQLPHREGLVTYQDALAGHFTGDFWHLARRDVLGNMRFDERARGGEAAVWWRMLRERPAWLVPNVVEYADRSSVGRLSVPGYTRGTAIGVMWNNLAMLGAVGEDLKLAYPRRYGTLLGDTAKWAALAGDGRRARAASRQALRFHPSRRTILMILVALAPRAFLQWSAELKSRKRRPG